MFLRCCRASSGELELGDERSILLRTSTGTTRSSHACLSTACVCVHTPSTASTTSSAPSLSRAAADTSEQKSTWPGESIRLTRTSSPPSAGRYASAIDDAFIVMPRSCSSSRLSMYRTWPASRDEMMPFDAISPSASVVLPWSTCARMQRLMASRDLPAWWRLAQFWWWSRAILVASRRVAAWRAAIGHATPATISLGLAGARFALRIGEEREVCHLSTPSSTASAAW